MWLIKNAWTEKKAFEHGMVRFCVNQTYDSIITLNPTKFVQYPSTSFWLSENGKWNDILKLGHFHSIKLRNYSVLNLTMFAV